MIFFNLLNLCLSVQVREIYLIILIHNNTWQEKKILSSVSLMYNVCSSFDRPIPGVCIGNFVKWLFAHDTCSRNTDKHVLCLFALLRWWKNTQFPTTQTFMSFCRILEKDWVNWRKVSQGKMAYVFIDQLMDRRYLAHSNRFRPSTRKR